MPDVVRQFWDGFDPDRMDRTVTGLGRKPALERAAALAEPLLAREGRLAADFGCGTGQLSLHAGTRRIVGVERSAALAARAATRMDRVVRAELRELPFADGSFEVGFLLFVIDDYRDKPPIVSEAARVLRPRATLIVGAYSPVDQHMGYLGTEAHLHPSAETLRVWLADLPGLCELLGSQGCRVRHTERIPSRYRVNAEECARRVAQRQGVTMDVARELMGEAGITEWVEREFLVVAAAKVAGN